MIRLPEGYATKTFERDPDMRRNHLYCRETDEVFHVDEETFNEVLGIGAPPPQGMKPAETGKKNAGNG